MLYDDIPLEILTKVLQRLEKHGVRIKLKKCRLMADSVDYLGHRIYAQGLHALSEKVEAITKAPIPKNITELQSFLGLLLLEISTKYCNYFEANQRTITG